MRILRTALAVTALSATMSATHAAPAEKLFTIGTSPDPQTQLMAMVLTFQASLQGAQTHILLCDPAGQVALKDAFESVLAPQKPKVMYSQALMMKILENSNASAEACAIYLPNSDLTTNALVDGVTSANPEVMTARLLDENHES